MGAHNHDNASCVPTGADTFVCEVGRKSHLAAVNTWNR